MASHRLRGVWRKMLTAALVVAALVSIVVAVNAPAKADPAPPGSVSAALHQLAELNQQAEALTEAWHAAQDQLAARQAALSRAQAAAAAARSAANAAFSTQERFRGQIDQLTSASYQGAQLNQLSALLASSSPRDYLDQLSTLDMVAVQTKQSLDGYTAAAARADQAAGKASAAAAAAKQAADDADQVAGQAQARKEDADRQIEAVQRQLATLSQAARTIYNGAGQTNFPLNVVGTGVGVDALRVALSRQGSPYVWGATGPGSFDCSGLVYWAYKQVGVTLPRSAAEQAGVGTEVPEDQLQPGDLVFFYNPIHHVAIYVGGGKVLHAPQSGDVVKVAEMSGMPFTTARRI